MFRRVKEWIQERWPLVWKSTHEAECDRLDEANSVLLDDLEGCKGDIKFLRDDIESKKELILQYAVRDRKLSDVLAAFQKEYPGRWSVPIRGVAVVVPDNSGSIRHLAYMTRPTCRMSGEHVPHRIHDEYVMLFTYRFEIGLPTSTPPELVVEDVAENVKSALMEHFKDQSVVYPRLYKGLS